VRDGLELTRPFHDKCVVELALAIPQDLYVKNGRNRYLACAAFKDIYPPEFQNHWRKNDDEIPEFQHVRIMTGWNKSCSPSTRPWYDWSPTDASFRGMRNRQAEIGLQQIPELMAVRAWPIWGNCRPNSKWRPSIRSSSRARRKIRRSERHSLTTCQGRKSQQY
jgi:Asparagine synthase